MSDVIKVLMITGNSEILHEIITFLKENSQYQSMNLSMPSNTLTASASGIHTVRGIGYKFEVKIRMFQVNFSLEVPPRIQNE